MPNYVNSSSPASHQPQYPELVRFLLTPLLDVPESLRIDCEWTNNNQRVLIRLALEQSDQGKLFGRGGRNLNAVRTVLTAAASAAQQSVYLDVYGEKETSGDVGKKPTSRSERPQKPMGKDGKRKPQKRSKPSPNRSADEPSPELK
ncbi:MAG: KH domain-containing protein [Halothece sp. Uz-M2-17]|nr:KH domain-containing protein [Halothece sp. Uz-M2-17]